MLNDVPLIVAEVLKASGQSTSGWMSSSPSANAARVVVEEEDSLLPAKTLGDGVCVLHSSSADGACGYPADEGVKSRLSHCVAVERRCSVAIRDERKEIPVPCSRDVLVLASIQIREQYAI